MVMFHVLFETVMVNYVVPGSCPSTTHSGDTVLMRFGAFRWYCTLEQVETIKPVNPRVLTDIRKFE